MMYHMVFGAYIDRLAIVPLLRIFSTQPDPGSLFTVHHGHG